MTAIAAAPTDVFACTQSTIVFGHAELLGHRSARAVTVASARQDGNVHSGELYHVVELPDLVSSHHLLQYAAAAPADFVAATRPYDTDRR